MTDMINPDHYKGNRKYEPIAVIEDWGLNYRLGNAVKYLSRNGRKPGEDPREGLRKAIWYIEREIASLEAPGPYGTTYEDVLEDFAACAAEGTERLHGYAEMRDDGPVGGLGLDYLGQAEWNDDDILGLSEDAIHAAEEVPFQAMGEDILSFDIDFGDYEPYNTGTSVNLRKKEELKEEFNGRAVKSAFDHHDFWYGDDSVRFYRQFDSDEDFMWDPSLGPVELTRKEIEDTLAKKDLKQFQEDEIVSTFERRGLIIGVKKDGSTCLLGDNGRCQK